MSDFFESIKRGMEEAIAHSKGDKTEVRLFVPKEVNVKQVCEKTGLTQNQFASTFGISLGCELASNIDPDFIQLNVGTLLVVNII